MSGGSNKQTGEGSRIDIFIPAIEKDLGTLPYVIDSAKKHVQHPIGRIYVVSPDSARIKSVCRRKGCTFVNERSLLPITKADIHYRSKKWDRSGWLYQQLLKLGGDKLGSQKHYLVMDADTVLIRPHTFKSGGKPVFYCRKWSQPEYFRTYSKLMGKKKTAASSFVTHYMLFNKAKVAQLKQKIAAKHGTSWYTAIIRSIDKTKQFGFSEYETYGNYIHSIQPGQLVIRSAMNKSLSMNASQVSSARMKELAKKYRSISFHKRKCYVR
ncbi:DUF6492 family protein [Paenibacillus mendelii]|uniref:DUF6492 family protein n=1 Tax=Paenibacillus mendelii TaxID=206163 RepID=A0ABV6JAF3_9BACL|nr:DUF6492 family protein [Paenibacillus mendelii]MCQ6560761.1 DUF6492 family protein [Paenibacillus mendelii]